MTAGDHAPLESPPPSPEGLVLAPFRALRYANADRLADLLSPPYDVIDEEQRRRLERSDPYNAVHLILPRDDETGPPSRYRRAATLLAGWRRAGVLVRDREPALYVYELSSATSVTRGLLGALGLVRPEAGIVLPHEDTMAGPVTDRLALTEATCANLEPIYLVYDGSPQTAQVLSEAEQQAALIDAETGDGLRHRLWSITDHERLHAVATELLPRRALIADGHHRYATYLRHQTDRRTRGAGPGPWDFGLAFLVDAQRFGPHVEAIHRVIRGLPLTDAVRRAGNAFTIRSTGPISNALAALETAGRSGPAFVLTDGADWHLLTGPDPAVVERAVPAGRSAAWRGLDVTIAHRVLVEHLWGLQDREEVVGFEHGAADAVSKAAQAGGTALLLNPTPVGQIAAVAAAGERMPRKSTLFLPKPKTGIVFRPFDEDS